MSKWRQIKWMFYIDFFSNHSTRQSNKTVLLYQSRGLSFSKRILCWILVFTELNNILEISPIFEVYRYLYAGTAEISITFFSIEKQFNYYLECVEVTQRDTYHFLKNLQFYFWHDVNFNAWLMLLCQVKDQIPPF